MKASIFAASSLLSLGMAHAAKTIVSQTVDVFAFTGDFGGGYGPAVDPGNAIATATRTEAGIGLFVNTKNLPAGTYTIWWFIVNDPSVCLKEDTEYPHNCDWSDVTNADNSALITATGDIVDERGTFQATAWLPVGETVGEDGAQVLPGSVRGALTDPWGSEIHLDLLYHGPPILPLGDGSSIDDLYGQLRYTKGGCQYYFDNGGMDPAPRVDGACPAFHSAIFPPADDPNSGNTGNVATNGSSDESSAGSALLGFGAWATALGASYLLL